MLVKRSAGQPPPWTTDEIIQKNHFVNVFKEDDPVTKVGAAQTKGLRGADLLATATAVCLTIDKDTIEAIGPLNAETLQSPKEQLRITKAIQEHGLGGGYVIPPFGPRGSIKEKQLPQVIAAVARGATPDLLNSFREQESPSDALVKWLQTFSNVGEFISYQVALRAGAEDPSLYDNNSHVVACMGAKRGLTWLCSGIEGIKPEHLPDDMVCDLMSRLQQELHDVESHLGYQALRLCDVEANLCELDKYCKGFYCVGSLKRIRWYCDATQWTGPGHQHKEAKVSIAEARLHRRGSPFAGRTQAKARPAKLDEVDAPVAGAVAQKRGKGSSAKGKGSSSSQAAPKAAAPKAGGKQQRKAAAPKAKVAAPKAGAKGSSQAAPKAGAKQQQPRTAEQETMIAYPKRRAEPKTAAKRRAAGPEAGAKRRRLAAVAKPKTAAKAAAAPRLRSVQSGLPGALCSIGLETAASTAVKEEEVESEARVQFANSRLAGAHRKAWKSAAAFAKPPSKRGRHAVGAARVERATARVAESIAEMKRLNKRDHDIALRPFVEVMKEVVSEIAGKHKEFRVSSDAVACLRGASEDFLLELFGTSNLFAENAGRITLMKQDVALYERVLINKYSNPAWQIEANQMRERNAKLEARRQAREDRRLEQALCNALGTHRDRQRLPGAEFWVA